MWLRSIKGAAFAERYISALIQSFTHSFRSSISLLQEAIRRHETLNLSSLLYRALS